MSRSVSKLRLSLASPPVRWKAIGKPPKSRKAIKRVAIVSYDEKPGIQAIATTAPDLPPKPGVHASFAQDTSTNVMAR